MKTLKLFGMILGLALMFCVGCGEDDDDDTVDTGSGTTIDTSSDYVAPQREVLRLDFEDGQGGGDKFYVSVPAADDADITDCTVVEETEEAVDTDSAVDTATDTAVDTAADTADTAAAAPDQCILSHYADNNTAVEMAGQNALKIHVDAYNRFNSTGPSVEVQFTLDEADVNMSDMSDDGFFTVSFDVYVPSELEQYNCQPQFALFTGDDGGYTPIYSNIHSVTYDAWQNISGEVKDSGGDISYSGFENDPDDWLMDYVRVQLMCDEAAGAVDDIELTFYLDNIVVSNL